MKILMVNGHAESFRFFHIDLIRDMIRNGHEVTVAAPESEEKESAYFNGIGASYRSICLERNGMNPLHDIKTIRSIREVMCELKPDKVFCFQAKGIIYSSIAAKLCGISDVYALVCGMGSVLYADGQSKKATLTAAVLRAEYRLALSCVKNVIFLNPENRDYFVRHNIVAAAKARIIPATGVNMKDFPKVSMPSEKRFLFVGRLLRDKGLMELLDAARKVKAIHPEAVFDIVGDYDTNMTAITADDLRSYIDDGTIICHGKRNDVAKFDAASYCLVLPSYHEGTPKSVLEAMATGRPIITTDAPGCHEIVEDGVNGYIVPVRDSEILAERMIHLIENEDTAIAMGERSYEMVVEKYDANVINRMFMDIIFSAQDFSSTRPVAAISTSRLINYYRD